MDKCYHLISRAFHCTFYLIAEARTRFVERMRRVGYFAAANVSPDGKGKRVLA